MKIYRIEMMNSENYNTMMTGGYGYRVDYYDVEAESEEQALAIAEHDNPSYYLHKGYVREVAKREHTTSEKDRTVARIAELEKALETARNYLRELENRA